MSSELERKVLKEIQFQETMTWDLAEKWADGIPVHSENDPNNPEWPATPTIPLYVPDTKTVVLIKDESDTRSNPTGTHKDRAAHEFKCLYRDIGRALLLRRSEINGKIEERPVPRLTVITSGNEGLALANAFQPYGLPPPHLIVGLNTPHQITDRLVKECANVYQTDLESKALSPSEIRRIANVEHGLDITSTRIVEPNAIFYDWLAVQEVFNENPDEIYLPRGSARLMENLLTHQERNVRLGVTNSPDPRLRIPISRLASIDVLGAIPGNIKTKADKLSATHSPFLIFSEDDISGLRSFCWTGNNTGVYQVSEDHLGRAYELLSQNHVTTSHSGAAGLALYLQRHEQGKIDLRKRVLIINTGKGI